MIAIRFPFAGSYPWELIIQDRDQVVALGRTLSKVSETCNLRVGDHLRKLWRGPREVSRLRRRLVCRLFYCPSTWLFWSEITSWFKREFFLGFSLDLPQQSLLPSVSILALLVNEQDQCPQMEQMTEQAHKPGQLLDSIRVRQYSWERWWHFWY